MPRQNGIAVGGHARIGLAAILYCGALAAAIPLDAVEHLGYWVDQGVVPDSEPWVQRLDKQLLQDDAIPLSFTEPVAAAALYGHLTLESPQGYARITLVDDQLREHLIAEFYPLMSGASELTLDGVCRETCLLDAVIPHRLKITIEGATLELGSLELRRLPAIPVADLAERREKIRAAQSKVIVARINDQIAAHGLAWQAGETAISRMSFADRKARSAVARVPVLQGFEYYVGGVYEWPGNDNASSGNEARKQKPPGQDTAASGGGALISRFDWREKHRANQPGSPYYDGDQTGSGWITPITEQACSDCWVFSTIGVLEAMVNLSLNRHLDANLSEQHLLSCSGGGDCDGGEVRDALDFVVSDMAVNELCFPYEGAPTPCTALCPDPGLVVLIDRVIEVPLNQGDDAVKQALMEYGPLTFGVKSWWHYMVLVGFDRDPADGGSIWLLKNSWGTDWGESGYAELKMPVAFVYSVYGISGIQLLDQGQLAPAVCRDADDDGYAAWGLNTQRPADCVTTNGLQDCNDADSRKGPAVASGACADIADVPPAPVVPPPPAPPPAPPPVPPADTSGGGGGGGCTGLGLMALLTACAWAARCERRQHRDRLIKYSGNG